MNYDETVVVDAILADLAATVDLPEHGTVKYVEPRALRMDVKQRWLAVYPLQIDHTVLATPDAYDNQLRVRVAWYAPVWTGAEANQGEEPVAKSALEEARRIRRHLQSYAAGVPSLVNVSAVVMTTTFDVRGSVTWKAEVTLFVEQFEGGPDDG